MNTFEHLLTKISPALVLLALFSGCSMVDRIIVTPTPTVIPTTVTPTPTAAEAQGIAVPFTSLERENTGSGTGNEYGGGVPTIVVLSDGEEAQAVLDWVSRDGQEALASTDYEQFSVIGVFRGSFPTTGYEIQVMKVTRIDDAIAVWAQFSDPQPGFAVGDLVTHPYEIIQVRKEDIDGATRFFLFANNILQGFQVDPYPFTPVPAATVQTEFASRTEVALAYIASRMGVPVDQLEVGNQHLRTYPALGKSYWAVVAHTKRGQSLYVLVDLVDGSIIDDPLVGDQAEREAQLAKYGALDPDLYQRLQTMGPKDTVKVAIWVIGTPRRSQEELYQALAERFPEARESLNRSGTPFAVEDHEKFVQIAGEHLRLMDEDYAVFREPVVALLESQGYKVTVFVASPSFSAELPKEVILQLADVPQVGRIYLSDAVSGDERGDPLHEPPPVSTISIWVPYLLKNAASNE